MVGSCCASSSALSHWLFYFHTSGDLISSGRLSYRWLFAIAIAIAVEVEGEASYVVLDHHDVTRGASSSGDFLYSLHQWVSAVALAPIGMADLYLNAVGS